MNKMDKADRGASSQWQLSMHSFCHTACSLHFCSWNLIPLSDTFCMAKRKIYSASIKGYNVLKGCK